MLIDGIQHLLLFQLGDELFGYCLCPGIPHGHPLPEEHGLNTVLDVSEEDIGQMVQGVLRFQEIKDLGFIIQYVFSLFHTSRRLVVYD